MRGRGVEGGSRPFPETASFESGFVVGIAESTIHTWESRDNEQILATRRSSGRRAAAIGSAETLTLMAADSREGGRVREGENKVNRGTEARIQLRSRLTGALRKWRVESDSQLSSPEDELARSDSALAVAITRKDVRTFLFFVFFPAHINTAVKFCLVQMCSQF